MSLRVTGLFIHPIKACGIIAVDELQLDAKGAINDRRWMLVDETGRFVSQRTHKRLALVKTRIHHGSIELATAQSELSLPREMTDGRVVDATIWKNTVPAIVHEEGSRWFSAFLGETVTLVFFSPNAQRQVDLVYAQPGDRVSFADAYPLLVISEESLMALNSKLAMNNHPGVVMGRFRPNIVISGGEPFLEDRMRSFTIGGQSFRGVKKCARCSVVQIDPNTGVAEIEPLRTLATFRLQDGHVMFGMNVIHNASGTIRVGDAVEVLE